MTVANTTNRTSYVGNGVTVDFPTVYFQQNTDLIVTVDAVPQIINVNYSVTGAMNPSGGTVTFSVAPANGAVIVIRNIPNITQLIDFVNNVTILDSVLNSGLDKLTIIAQNLQDQINDALRKDSLIANSTWDAQGLEIKSAGNGTAGNSVATVSQVQAVQIAAGNVPSPVSGDVGKFLSATAPGVFNWQPASAVGTALLAAGNLFAATAAQQIRRTETSLQRQLLRFIGGSGAGVGASIEALCTATGIDDIRSLFGAVEYMRTTYNNAVPYTEFLRQVGVPFRALTDAATITWDLSEFQNATITLGGNRTLAAPTNLRSGFVYNLLVQQDATGGRTLALNNAVYRFPGGAEPVVASSPNAISLISFVAFGTSMLGVGQLDFT